MFIRHQMESHRYRHATNFWYENLARIITRASIDKDYSPIVSSIQSKIGDSSMQDIHPFMRDVLLFLDGFNLLDDAHSDLAKIAIKFLSPQKCADNLGDATTITPTISPKRCE
jgi:hypothetical protein